MTTYRDNGAIGALLDEYEKALLELNALITDITPTELINIVDSETKDEDCRSIQTILSHVVRAGHNYAIVIRKSMGEQLDYFQNKILPTSSAYAEALDEMFRYNEKLFQDYPQIILEEYDADKKILVSWGQLYDVDQLMEHAICHILRHRRQIERFLLKLR